MKVVPLMMREETEEGLEVAMEGLSLQRRGEAKEEEIDELDQDEEVEPTWSDPRDVAKEVRLGRLVGELDGFCDLIGYVLYFSLSVLSLLPSPFQVTSRPVSFSLTRVCFLFRLFFIIVGLGFGFGSGVSTEPSSSKEPTLLNSSTSGTRLLLRIQTKQRTLDLVRPSSPSPSPTPSLQRAFRYVLEILTLHRVAAVFPSHQLYAVLLLPYGGIDLESYSFSRSHGWAEAAGVFWSVSQAIAVAEKEVRFEVSSFHARRFSSLSLFNH